MPTMGVVARFTPSTILNTRVPVMLPRDTRRRAPDYHACYMLAKDLNERLTHVGRDTPMGDLMRRYWHPIAASKELDSSPFRTRPIRVLGEDLVLSRDRSGKLGLIERFCPHRRVDLAIGVVEQD